MSSTRLRHLIRHTGKFGFVTERFKEKTKSAYNHAGISLEANNLKRFDELSTGNEQIADYNYGPFGALLRRNIVDQWWRHSVTLQDRVFPISVITLDNSCDGFATKTQSSFLPRKRAQQNYDTLSKDLLSQDIGVAQITILPSQNFSSTFILRSPSHEYLTLHHLCHMKKGGTLFNELIKQRLRWWKKYANKQARFEHHVKENGTYTTTAEISYECSFGKETVETIHLGMKDEHDAICESNTNIIECCTTVEQALLAYLDDGLEERIFDEEDNEIFQDVLRLHPSISPIKLIILAEDPQSEGQVDLVHRIGKEVQTAGISCHKLFLKKESEVYNFADAIGTPFSLRIDERTLQRGIVGLRHRDTTVHEFLHISEVRETLTKIMKF